MRILDISNRFQAVRESLLLAFYVDRAPIIITTKNSEFEQDLNGDF